MAEAQIPLPGPLNSKNPEEWRRWKARFECYRVASGLDKKDEKVQVNTLVYAMGGNSVDILTSFSLSTEQFKYATVTKSFDAHFEGKVNVIYERARFNRRIQTDSESVIDFIEDLHKLSERCKFGALKDELIRDRIVVGITDIGLAKKLMQDENLTLEKAINSAKATEMVTSHQKFLKGESEVSRVQARRGRHITIRAPSNVAETHMTKMQTKEEVLCFKFVVHWLKILPTFLTV